MAEQPNSSSATFWANLVAVIGQIYIFLSLAVAVILFLYQDDYCRGWGGCSFLESRPLALAGVGLFFSGLTFGAPMVALGRYFAIQIQFRNFENGIEVSTNQIDQNPMIPKYDGTF